MPAAQDIQMVDEPELDVARRLVAEPSSEGAEMSNCALIAHHDRLRWAIGAQYPSAVTTTCSAGVTRSRLE
jgi:hypothetical protein